MQRQREQRSPEHLGEVGFPPSCWGGVLQAPPAGQRAQGEFFPHSEAGERSGLEERNQGPGPHIWVSEMEHWNEQSLPAPPKNSVFQKWQLLFVESLLCTKAVLIVFFFWNIIALQCCVTFCHTALCVSYMYTYVPSLLNLPPSPQIPPLQVTTEHWAELPVLHSNFPLAVHVTHGSVYMSMLLSQFVPPAHFKAC